MLNNHLPEGDCPMDFGVEEVTDKHILALVKTRYGDGAVCDVSELLQHYDPV